ncbi:porin family protein [Shewanella psychropiezotolerans]|uniref:Porin family protein n=2 Tax=Shewanellaceae TaxID=267890 RepID=A0ABX5X3Y4_9GAMM|nr:MULTISPECIES: outer membrane beta-barrel protein [Shewanella]MPY25577.1 porin family protein [Shewanella sp. YLB-07]QDO86064.1 porin family protein [Shewanella psychropiezotolerans]
MKTQSLVLAAAIATIMSAPTMATEWFVGGGIAEHQTNYKTGSSLQIQGDTPDNSMSRNSSEEGIAYELRGGAYLNDHSRVYGTYSYFSEYLSKQQSFLVSYDYLIGLNASKSLNWFVGATAGVTHLNPKQDGRSSKNGFAWGGQTGLMYKITDSISTEVGYRYLTQDIKFAATETEGAMNTDHNHHIYLAVDYRF